MKRIDEWAGGDHRARQFLRRCKEAVQELAPDADVILFGSRARGECSPESDYDLLVLTRRPATPGQEEKIRECLYDLELEYEVVMSTFIYSRQRWDGSPWRVSPFHKNVEAHGILL